MPESKKLRTETNTIFDRFHNLETTPKLKQFRLQNGVGVEKWVFGSNAYPSLIVSLDHFVFCIILTLNHSHFHIARLDQGTYVSCPEIYLISQGKTGGKIPVN